MKITRIVTLAMVLVIGIVGYAGAMPVLYYNEANYLAALSLPNVYTISEDFEGSVWSPFRYPNATPSITSQGLTWTSSDSVTTGNGWARSGQYGIFDTYGDPDHVYAASSAATMVGFGGWFATSDAYNISLSLDGQHAGTINPGQWASHTFFGVIDVSGFNQVEMAAPSGHFGADDFTAGAVPEPSTLILFGVGLIGVRALQRRRRAKK